MKFRLGFGKMQNTSTENNNLTATREVGFTKIWARDAGIFLPVFRDFEKSYVLVAPGNQPSESPVVSSVLSRLPLCFSDFSPPLRHTVVSGTHAPNCILMIILSKLVIHWQSVTRNRYCQFLKTRILSKKNK